MSAPSASTQMAVSTATAINTSVLMLSPLRVAWFAADHIIRN